MFRIIWNYGLEGWQFEDKTFNTAQDALAYAMKEPHAQFKIVEDVVFVSAKNTEQQVQPDKFQERCTFPNNYIICGAYSDGICKSPKGTCRLT